MRRHLGAFIICRVCCVSLGSMLLVSSALAGTLQTEMAGAALKIAQVLDGLPAGNKEIQLGLFQPDSGDPSMVSYGRRIAESLRQELMLADVTISSKARIRLFGEFRLNAELGKVAVDLNLKNIDDQVQSRISSGPFTLDVDDIKEILLISHPTTAIDPQASKKEVVEAANKSLREGIESLEKVDDAKGDGFLKTKDLPLAMRLVEIDPNLSALDSNFIKGSLKPLADADTAGVHYRIPKDLHFAVEIGNLDRENAYAFELFVDGINSFALSDMKRRGPRGEDIPEFQHWAVYPGSRSLIPGWFKNTQQASAFQIVPDEKSVAARLGKVEGIGTIQLLIYASWEKGTEPKNPKHKLFAKRGTGEGKMLKTNISRAELEVGALIGTLTVQYESQP
jgi:hypothetical protein